MGRQAAKDAKKAERRMTALVARPSGIVDVGPVAARVVARACGVRVVADHEGFGNERYDLRVSLRGGSGKREIVYSPDERGRRRIAKMPADERPIVVEDRPYRGRDLTALAERIADARARLSYRPPSRPAGPFLPRREDL